MSTENKPWDPADVIVSQIAITFSMRDRIKILLNGRACVRCEVKCEYSPGSTLGDSTAYTPRLFPKTDSGGYASIVKE
jgi:hypothetical protein